MKQKLILFLLLLSCATTQPGPWLLERGKQLHKIEVTRKSGTDGPKFLSFDSVADLGKQEAHVVAMSPVGTTLFKIDDQRNGEFKMHSIAPSFASKEKDLKLVYKMLRPLFWATQNKIPAKMQVLARNPKGGATRIAWELGNFDIVIEVAPL